MHIPERIRRLWTPDSGEHKLRFIRVRIKYNNKDYHYHVSLIRPRGGLLDRFSVDAIKQLRHIQNFVSRTYLIGLGEANAILYELYVRHDGVYKLYIYDVVTCKCYSASAVHSVDFIDFIID